MEIERCEVFPARREEDKHTGMEGGEQNSRRMCTVYYDGFHNFGEKIKETTKKNYEKKEKEEGDIFGE